MENETVAFTNFVRTTSEAAEYLAGRAHELMATASRLRGDSSVIETAMTAGNSKLAAAAHEAGHAVVYAVYQVPVVSIRIKRKKTAGHVFWTGRCVTQKTWRIGPDTSPEEIRMRSHMLLAGWIGEIRKTGMHAVGSCVDEITLAGELARGLLTFNPGWELPKLWLQLVAETLLVINHYGSLHDELTTRLLRTRHVRGEVLKNLLTRALAGPSERSGKHGTGERDIFLRDVQHLAQPSTRKGDKP